MGTHNIEEALKGHLERVGVGYAKSDAFIEFLRQSLTNEELEVILGLPAQVPPFEVEEVDTIAQRVGMEPKKAEEALEGLSAKGLAYKKTTDSGKPGYGFIQWAFGFPQIFFWKGEKTPQSEKASEIFNFEDVSILEKSRGTENTRSYRYVPIEKAVDYTMQGVLPYEQMTGIVERSEVIAVAHCPCRMAHEIAGNRECNHTLENCLKFNDMARFIIDKGIGREISKEEAIEIIKKTEEEGLIHFVDNCQEDVHHNCNCCPCCCWNVAPIKKRIVPRDYIMDTYFLRITENEACTGCEACVDACPLDIITMEDGYPLAELDICIGCGVCLYPCPTGAAKLKRREDKKPPFATFKELYETELKEVWKS
jgi:Na+-translocating ferredoxin:NAD+ oxidoreductase RNF subunit RnfB